MIDDAENVDRRTFFRQSASLMAVAAAALAVHAEETDSAADLQDPIRIPGALPCPYGERSPFETLERVGAGGPGSPHGWEVNAPNNINSTTPLQDLDGIVTPSALHFERHHNGVPAVDPARHRLLIHGLVDRPMLLTLDDLERVPSVSRLAFFECSGNSWDCWFDKATDFTVQELHGLTSTSEWTGVKLSTLLEIVGVQRGAHWMLAEGSDAAGLDRSVPLTSEVLDEPIICYGQERGTGEAGARVSVAPPASRIRRQHQRKVAEEAQAWAMPHL